MDESLKPLFDVNQKVLEKVMVISPHPDDAEGNCGGTMARWAREGRTIHYLILTNGDKGSDEPSMTSEKLAGIREKEFLWAEYQEALKEGAKALKLPVRMENSTSCRMDPPPKNLRRF